MFLADNIKLSSWLPAGATVLLASPIVQADNFMLQPGIELTGSQSLNLVHFIDHDHDGLTDVVAHDAARMKIHVFRQTSAKLIEPTPSLSIPNVLSPYSQSADLNEDGYCDLVYQSGSQLHIMLSSSAGLTAAGSILISEPLHHLTAIGDFDGDGHIDLFLSPHVRDVYDSLLNPKPHILWGIGNGGFEEMPTPLPNIGNHRTAYYRFIQKVDMDGDGSQEIFAYGNFTRSILSVQPDRSITVRDLGTEHSLLHDLDGDGRADSVKFRLNDPSSNLPAVVVRKQNTDGSFSPEVVSPVNLGTTDLDRHPLENSITLADLDGDGDSDLVLRSKDLSETIQIKNLGNATFSDQIVRLVSPESILRVSVHDLDQDGTAEILTHEAILLVNDAQGGANQLRDSSISARIFWSNASGHASGLALGYTARPRVLKHLDIDGDNLNDLLYLERSSPGVTWLKKLTSGSLDYQKQYTVPLPGLQGGDFEVFGGGSVFNPLKVLGVTSNHSVYQTFGTSENSYLTQRSIINPALGSSYLTIDQVNTRRVHGFIKKANIDQDTDPDFITANPLNGDLIWYEYHEQTGTWSTPVKIDSPVQAAEVSIVPYQNRRLVTVLDTDGDGYDEVYYVLNHNRKEIHRAEYNNLTTSFDITLPNLFQGITNVESLGYGDIDQDGDDDLLWTSRANSIGTQIFLSWMENDGGQLINPTSLTDLPFTTVAFAVADMDGDGVSDIVSMEGLALDALGNPSSRSTISWIKQRSLGVFDPPISMAKSMGPGSDLLVKDINGDGRLDIIQASATGASVELFINTLSDNTPSYSTWLTDHGVTVENSDEDAFTNMEEYYYDLNPANKEFMGSLGAPKITITPHGKNSGRTFNVEVNRRKGIDPAEWPLVLEVSYDLVTWTPAIAPATVCWDPARPNHEQISWNVYESVGGDFFVRLKLSHP